MTTLINNKAQMLHLFAAWKIVTGAATLPARKGALPVYLRIEGQTLNLVKIENIGKGLFRVTMKTEN